MAIIKKDRLYATWQSMKQRCLNPNHKSYAQYGGRGINVCDEWLHDFASYRDWSIDNGFCDGKTLDRINPNIGYQPSNCQYIPSLENCRKQRSAIMVTINGITDSIRGWGRRTGIDPGLIRYRMNNFGWNYEMAITIPRNKMTTLKLLRKGADHENVK